MPRDTARPSVRRVGGTDRPGAGRLPGTHRLLRQPGRVFLHPPTPHPPDGHLHQSSRRARAPRCRRPPDRPGSRFGTGWARRATDTELDARQFTLESPLVCVSAAVERYAAPSFSPGRPVLEAAADLCSRIHAGFRYRPGSTSVTTGLDEVIEGAEGVCQDFAQLAIGCFRSRGLAARYVSGYLETRPPPGATPTPRRRRLPRLGVSVRARPGLGRHRPDQRPVRQRPLRRHRMGSRLQRRPPAQRRHLHRGHRPRTGGRPSTLFPSDGDRMSSWSRLAATHPG